jgi:CRISPR-associated endonuclease/helicase Cas3
MPVYSHSKLNKDGKREGSKLLIEHLKGVRDKALASYSERTYFSNQNNRKSLIENICWLHDLGKYTNYFQSYLLDSGKVEQRLKNHSSLGAHVAFNLLRKNPKEALIAYYMIKLHHSNLLNFDEVLWPEYYNSHKWLIHDAFKKQVDNLQKTEELKDYISEIDKNVLKHTEPKDLFKLYKSEFQDVDTIEFYFMINYLFSLLIESDKLDASETTQYELTSLPANAVDDRPGIGKPEYPKSDLSSFSQNELRNFVRSEVVKNIGRDDILQKRIFTLAAPTGIGKTLTALDFSLKLRQKIESEEGHLSQIIYGLPFINIIEQALSEYEKTLGKGKILGHYQFADIFGKDKLEENSLDDTESDYSRKKMAWDTWQSDIVITSFVQLFETMIGNRNRLLKKFHHFADSIIILDEVQTLAIEKLPIIGATLYYLSKYLNTRIIIMTATQPKLFKLMERELDVQINESNLKPFNLLERDGEVFSCFNRTKIIPLLDEQIDNEKFTDLFESKWSANKSCLIVVNKVNRSIEIFDLLKNHLSESDVELFYLSTNITPVERQRRVEEVKRSLPSKTCILVSTQVVEAGVDLDFDMGFRDLGPIDSIVQVAGRINRENSEARMGSPIYVVDFGDCQQIYGYATNTKSHAALNKAEIPENEYKYVVENYFESVSDAKLSDFEFSRGIFQAMKNLRYGYPKSSSEKKITVGDFKIIENSQNGISVFVELPEDPKGTEARTAFQALINNEIPRHEFDRKYKRAFHQRIIAVPDYLPNIKELSRLTEDILWIEPDVAEFYYDKYTGFLRREGEEKAIMF